MYELVRPLLFRMDPETAHERAVELGERLSSADMLLRLIRSQFAARLPQRTKTLLGMEFPSPVGLAGGFDKDGRLVPLLAALGFGFIEVGTVTPRPQPGNPRPRMFRFPEREAVVNRLGFNNEGAATLRRRLDELWNTVERRETSVKQGTVEHRGTRETVVEQPPLFVNIGKNKDTPPERAVEDYVGAYRMVAPVADAVVVNVSSPNTPGLRDLQAESALREILAALREERKSLDFRRAGAHPILVKMSPDMDAAGVEGVASTAVELAEGIVATNTTISRETLPEAASVTGGLSGAPLFARATGTLRQVRRLVGTSFPVIGVGGIMSVDDAAAKFDAGADLVQVYTGLIYRGPGFAVELARGLADRNR